MSIRKLPWRTLLPLAALVALVVAYVSRPDELPIDADSLTLIAPQVDIDGPRDLATRDGVFEALVVDEIGAPLPDALVSLIVGDELRGGTSGPDGVLRLGGVPRGAREVLVVASSRDPLRTKVEEGAAQQRLALGPVAAPNRFAGRERGSLAVQLKASEGVPVEGCEVLLLPEIDPHELDAPLPAAARADAQGAAAFAGLRPGAYLVHVRPGWAAGSDWPDLALPVRMAIGPAPHALEIALAARRVEVQVLDKEGRAVEGALVQPRPLDVERRVAPAGSTGADGKWLSDALPAGRWRFEAQAGALHAATEAVLDGAGAPLPLSLAPAP